jgi:hypothetical protein
VNTWQAVKQIQFLLQTATWPDTPGGPVFASVHITQGPAEKMLQDFRYPVAIIRVLDNEADAAAPGFKSQRLEVTLATAHYGDLLGEFSLMGGMRNSQGRSGGRGLLEVEEIALSTLNLIDQTSGLSIILAASSAVETAIDEQFGYVASRAFQFNTRLTTSRTYQTPNGTNALTLTAGAPSGGFTPVTVQWKAATQRFDFHPAYTVPLLNARGGFVLVRKTGSSAPASIGDGTNIALGSAFAVSVVDPNPVTGQTYTYGLFAKHDEYNDGATSLRYSSPAYATISV